MANFSFTRWESLGQADGVLVVVDAAKWKGNWPATVPGIPKGLAEALESVARRFEWTPAPGKRLSFAYDTKVRVEVLCVSAKTPVFNLLRSFRRALGPLLKWKCQKVAVDLHHVEGQTARYVEALYAALSAAQWEAPSYKQKPEKKTESAKMAVWFLGANESEVARGYERAIPVGEATNLVRTLTMMAGNDLTATRYVEFAEQIASDRKLKTEFFSLDALKERGAGAFLAVSQGAADRGGGILKIEYRPKQIRAQFPKKVALVGKGITYDTGGVSLKTGGHMFGMNNDMSGSAVVLASVLLAASQNWPFAVTGYLAITENALGSNSFRPNDVIRSLGGKTIEVVDTDAEGRLVLCDTLTLAGADSPDLIVDFATLTGACVRAIGTTYSGAFTNRRTYTSRIIRAGRESGERVWPFPLDADFAACLKSPVADVRQCRPSGGVDHIEAARFLLQFVPKKTPWIHIDLSSVENEGGLAHIPGKTTGVGPRFLASLLETLLVV